MEIGFEVFRRWETSEQNAEKLPAFEDAFPAFKTVSSHIKTIFGKKKRLRIRVTRKLLHQLAIDFISQFTMCKTLRDQPPFLLQESRKTRS
jgi:hypothetical protein